MRISATNLSKISVTVPGVLRERDTVATRPLLLLVDDDPIIADALRLVLEDNFTLYTAGTRNETKSLLRKLAKKPPLALVDLGLPPKPHDPDEGFALIRELLAFDPAMKILVLSGQNTNATIQHALTLGAVDLLHMNGGE